MDFDRSAWRLVLAALAMAGCASVSTHVVLFDPAHQFGPSARVVILDAEPERPFLKLGLIEAKGAVGAGETELLDDMRAKARAMGADAIVRLETAGTWVPPVAIEEPWYPPRYGFWRGRYYSGNPLFGPNWFGPLGYGSGAYPVFRTLPGGTAYTMKALAIRYE